MKFSKEVNVYVGFGSGPSTGSPTKQESQRTLQTQDSGGTMVRPSIVSTSQGVSSMKDVTKRPAERVKVERYESYNDLDSVNSDSVMESGPSLQYSGGDNSSSFQISTSDSFQGTLQSFRQDSPSHDDSSR